MRSCVCSSQILPTPTPKFLWRVISAQASAHQPLPSAFGQPGRRGGPASSSSSFSCSSPSSISTSLASVSSDASSGSCRPPPPLASVSPRGRALLPFFSHASSSSSSEAVSALPPSSSRAPSSSAAASSSTAGPKESKYSSPSLLPSVPAEAVPLSFLAAFLPYGSRSPMVVLAYHGAGASTRSCSAARRSAGSCLLRNRSDARSSSFHRGSLFSGPAARCVEPPQTQISRPGSHFAFPPLRGC